MASPVLPGHLFATVVAAGVAAVALATAASASGRQTGTLIVRLVTDPTPARVSWTYSGAGTRFQLDDSTREQILTLSAGTYTLTESPTEQGQANTLTALSCSDPDRNTQPNATTGSVSVGLEEGETVTCTFSHRAFGRRSAASTVALARRYAPVLRLTSGERYRPLRLEDYLTLTSLHSGSPPHGPLLQAQPSLFSLPTSPGSFYLDVGGAEPNEHASRYPLLERRLEAARPQPTIYWHIARQPGAGRVAIEYWFFYLYNDFYDKHEADWEGATVILQDNQPLGISYSAHQGRRWSTWTAQTTNSTHPIVYVARGSHANYPKRGRYGVRVCWTLYGHHCTPTPKIDDANGTGATLNPNSYQLQELGGTPYSGSWGSGTNILGIGRTKDQINDPRRRSDYSNPFNILPH